MSIWKNLQTKTEKVIPLLFAGTFATLLLISIFIRYKENSISEASPNQDDIIAYAESFLEGQSKEKPGKWLDCSGFTRHVFKEFSVKIPLTSYEQYRHYGGLSRENLQKSDLVFFNTTGSGISHVGIYIDNDLFIHSPGYNKIVRIDSLTHSYWKKCFISGGRITFNKNN